MIYRKIGILSFMIACFVIQDMFALGQDKSELNRQIEQAESDSQLVDLKLKLVDLLEHEGDHKNSLREIGNVLRISTMDGYEYGYLQGLLKMGDHYLNRDLPDSAKYSVREGLSQSRSPEFRFRFLTQQGTILRMEGYPEESIGLFQQAYELADSLDMKGEKGVIAYNLSISQKKTGDFSSSFENLYRALLNSEEVEDSVLKAKIMNEIGKMYYELENPSEGIYYLEEAKRLSREHELTNNLLSSLINLGISYLALGDEDEAETYLTDAKRQAGSGENFLQLIRIDYNLGLVNLKRGAYLQARDYFQMAMDQSSEKEFREGIFLNSIGLGDLYRQQSRYDEAVDWYKAAIDESLKMNSGRFTEQALEKLYIVNRDAGRHLNALEALETLRAYSDSIRSMERERSRAEYEARLESRRQEQENRILMARQSEQEARLQLQTAFVIGIFILLAIVLGVALFLYKNVRFREKLNENLKERNQEISTKNKELDHLNNIKNKMFAVVAHDLRGPLSSLQSLLYLLREHDLSKEELNEITNSLERSLHNNATTMENLLAWAKSQMNGIVVNYRSFKLIAAAEAVYSQVKFQAEQKGIRISIEINPELRVYADYDMIKLILRNLVSNSVKFTGEEDKIVIRAVPDGKMTTISVEDTGVGIKHNDQDKIFGQDHFSQAGTDNEQGSGLGLALCKEFVEKHGGNIWFESEYGSGTTFSFTLPVHKDITSEGEQPSEKKKVKNNAPPVLTG